MPVVQNNTGANSGWTSSAPLKDINDYNNPRVKPAAPSTPTIPQGSGTNPGSMNGVPVSPSVVPSQQATEDLANGVNPAQPSRPGFALPEFTYDLGGVNPNADLAYNAFLRGYGYDSSSARAQAAYKRAQLQSQIDGSAGLFDTQRQEGTTDAGESLAARGGARSSARLNAQDKVVRDVNSRESALKAGIADQQAQVTFGLQDTINQLERSRTEQELQARTRMVQEQNARIAQERAIAQLLNEGN